MYTNLRITALKKFMVEVSLSDNSPFYSRIDSLLFFTYSILNGLTMGCQMTVVLYEKL